MDSVQAEKEQNSVRWESAVSGRVYQPLHVLIRQQSAGLSQVFYIHTHLSLCNSQVILYMNIRDCGLSRRWEA